MIPSDEVVRLLHQRRGEAVVITTMTALRLWSRLPPRPGRDLPLVGSMGKASSLGLGLALARPDIPVIVVDGDGSLLMNLGSLVTVAHMAPPNFFHFVFYDGVYTTTGGQPVPGAGRFDFADLARAAGYPRAYDFADLEDLVGRLGEVLQGPGPVMACLHVSHPPELPPLRASTREALRAVRHALLEGGSR